MTGNTLLTNAPENTGADGMDVAYSVKSLEVIGGGVEEIVRASCRPCGSDLGYDRCRCDCRDDLDRGRGCEGGHDDDYDYNDDCDPVVTALDNDDAELMQSLLDGNPGLLEDTYCCSVEHDPIATAAAASGKTAILRMLLDHPGAAAALRRLDEAGRNYWCTPLTGACERGHLEAVSLLIEKAVNFEGTIDVNEVDNLGLTPLLAVAQGSRGKWASSPQPTESDVAKSKERIGIIRLLVDHGAVIHAQQTGPGDLDYHFGYSHINDELNCQANCQIRSRWGGSALVAALRKHWADPVSESTDTRVVKALVEAGADLCQIHREQVARLDGTSLLGGVVDESVLKSVAETVGRPRHEEDFVELTPLGVAAMYNNVEGIETLFELCSGRAGLEMSAILVPSSPSVIPPLHAALAGRPHTSTWGYTIEPWYVESGIEKAETDKWDIEDAVERHKLVMERAVKTIDLLTQDPAVCAATINRTFADINGRAFTPLHLAARFDRLPLLRVLLDRGANPSVLLPTDGRSVLFGVFASLRALCPLPCAQDYRPYMTARIHAAEAAVDMHALVGDLLRGLADNAINDADKDGNTCLHWAMGFGLAKSTAALLAHGAGKDSRKQAAEMPVEGRMPTSSRPMPNGYVIPQSEDDEMEDVDMM